MQCPFCGKCESEVLESRVVDDGAGVRRRRSCLSCHKRFSTIERIKEITIWVVKKDGRRELFSREKIYKGILKAVEKRPVSLSLIDDMVKRVENDIKRKNVQEVSANTIGRTVLKYLRKVDKVALLRYASVYFQFEDLADFEKLILKINP